MKVNKFPVVILKACRPRQWTKNLLVFASPLAAFQIFDIFLFKNLLVALISFCLISSSIYLINDVFDYKFDKHHPSKKFRPIAAGILSRKSALTFSLILTILSLLLSASHSVLLCLIVFIYLLIQLFYTLGLKNIAIIDLFCVTSGFLLRAVAGCIASDLPISTWFLLSITLLSLFIIVGKRKAELIYSDVSNSKTRPVLKKYSENLLIKLENLLATSTFITYSLWAAGPQLNGASSGWMILTVPFVLAGIFRYQLLSEIRNIESYKDKIKLTTEKPEEIILHDSGMKLIILGWLFITIIINFVS